MASAGQRALDERFRRRRVLRKGPGSSAEVADDLTHGIPVVIRRFTDAAVASRIGRLLSAEAEVLAGDDAPHLAVAREVIQDDDRLLLVRPYVDGVPLAARLGRPVPLDQVIDLAHELLSALEHIHARGVLHAGIHPDNVIVPANGDLRGATLVDVGAARSSFAAGATRPPRAMGRYTAPEAAGLIDHEVGEWSDLYSVGVLLHHAITGKPPFDGNDLGTILRLHLTRPAPMLRRLGISVPRAFDEIVQRLLAKDPRERYQSATGALADIDALRRGLDAGEVDPDFVVGLVDKRHSLAEPTFVGRKPAVERIQENFRHAKHGRPQILVVEADSGGGKTRLLEEAAQRAALGGAWILRGQGRAEVAPTPLEMLDGIVRAIDETGRRDPERIRALTQRLGDSIHPVTEALPALAPLLGVPRSAPVGPEAFGAERTLDALCELIDALGTPETPAIVILDDCQWADELTLRLLSHWTARHKDTQAHATSKGVPTAKAAHVAIVVAMRSEEVAHDHPLRQIPGAHQIHLEPFAPNEIRLLVESMAGALPDDAVAVITRLADGNPFMAAAVLRGLVESQALHADVDGWHVDPTLLAQADALPHLGDFLLRRLERLASSTRHMLSAAAVVGKEFDAELAARLSGTSATGMVEAMAESRQARLIWSTGPGTFAFAHDKIREALLSSLAGLERKRLHHEAAHHLEQQHQRIAFQLAYHYDAAGDSNHALPYALQAAEEARRRYSLHIAERYYRIAARAATHADLPTRQRIHIGLGDTLMLNGQYKEATPWFEQARAYAENDIERAEVDAKIGELAFKSGDVEAAAVAQEQVLRALGQRVPRTHLGFTVALVWELVVQVIHTWLPGLIRRRSGNGTEALQAARAYSKVAYTYWFIRGVVPCLWAHLRGMNITERYGATEERAQAYSEHAPAMSTIPMMRRGARYARRSYDIRTELGNQWGQGQSLHFLGLVLYADARYEEALRVLTESERILDRTGDRWEALNGAFHVAYVLERMGRLTEALDKARDVYRKADAIGDLQATAFTAEIWARVAEGHVPERIVERELARCPRSDAQSLEAILQAKGHMLLGRGRFREAADVFAQAGKVAAKGGLRSEYVATIQPWRVTALRRHIESLAPWAVDEREQTMREARRVLRAARSWARRYPNNRAQVMREAALIAALDGRGAAAERAFRGSLSAATRLGQHAEEARTRIERGRIGTPLGWPGAAEDRARGERRLAAMQGPDRAAPGAVTLSLLDRFTSVLDAGRTITTALDRTALDQALVENAERLLRGDACSVYHVAQSDGQARLERVAGEGDFPGDLLQRALREGGVVRQHEPRGRPHEPIEDAEAALDDDEAAVDESVGSRFAYRSALAAPVYVRGQPAAVLAVGHTSLEGLFREEEEHVAAYLATLAGGALENAAGFERLRQASQDLRFQKSLLEAQSEAAIDGILVVDAHGRILANNRRFAEMWHLDADILDLRDDERAVAAVLDQLDDPDAFTARIRYLYEHPTETSRDEIMLRDGRVFDRYSGPVVGEDGEVHGRVWYFHDISADRRSKEELRHAYDRLKEVDELKTRFINIAAHELNTPLTPLRIQLHLLRGGTTGALTERQERALQIVDRNMERLSTLVHELLDASRIQSGRVAVQPARIDLAEVVRDAAEPYKAMAPKHHLDFQLHVPNEMPFTTDAGIVAQAVHNLVSNAIKYTQPGGDVRIDLRPSGGGALLRVRDTGPGFSPEQLDLLFQPFSKVPDRGDSTTPGSGLGLFITRGVLERIGGTVEVLSGGPGKGATFQVRLPDLAAAVPLDVASPDASAGQATPHTDVPAAASDNAHGDDA